MISEQPLDMSRQEFKPSVKSSSVESSPPFSSPEVSPPAVTKLPKPRAISNPRDFFAKLYGTEDKKSSCEGTEPAVVCSSAVPGHFPPSPPHYPASPPPFPASYLHYAADPSLFRLDTLPLPGGLAAFCKCIIFTYSVTS